MELAAVQEQYRRRQPLYKRLEDECVFIISNALNSTDIKIHQITSRVKEFPSLLAKIERKQLQHPFDEIVDIVGLRVICLLRSDIQRIADVVRQHFNVNKEDNKIDGHEISSFGYQSVHFECMLKPQYAGPRYDQIKDANFEVQIRMIAMDAWAAISHYLDYKTVRDTPRELRKDFYALSSLFYVADSHFEMFHQNGIESKLRVDEVFRRDSESRDYKIDMDTLRAYLAKKFPTRDIDVDSEAYSNLIRELNQTGYT